MTEPVVVLTPRVELCEPRRPALGLEREAHMGPSMTPRGGDPTMGADGAQLRYQKDLRK